MDTKQALFAFKLAAKVDAKQTALSSQSKWKAQDGVALAGCTDYRFPGNVRAYSQIFGNDRGIYC
jgi:hypothetical protein